jgi:hypothetical protein
MAGGAGVGQPASCPEVSGLEALGQEEAHPSPP